MSFYEVVCVRCGRKQDQIHPIRDEHFPCPDCGAKMQVDMSGWTHGPGGVVKDSGWESENGGRGRYIGQMADRQPWGKNDPNAYCRSRCDLKEKAKRRGSSVSEA